MPGEVLVAGCRFVVTQHALERMRQRVLPDERNPHVIESELVRRLADAHQLRERRHGNKMLWFLPGEPRACFIAKAEKKRIVILTVGGWQEDMGQELMEEFEPARIATEAPDLRTRVAWLEEELGRQRAIHKQLTKDKVTLETRLVRAEKKRDDYHLRYSKNKDQLFRLKSAAEKATESFVNPKVRGPEFDRIASHMRHLTQIVAKTDVE